MRTRKLTKHVNAMREEREQRNESAVTKWRRSRIRRKGKREREEERVPRPVVEYKCQRKELDGMVC